MFCPSCGRPIESGASFCPVCGAPVALQTYTGDVPVAKPRRRYTFASAAIVILVAAAVLAMVVLVTTDPGDEERTITLGDSLVLGGALADGTVTAELTPTGFSVEIGESAAGDSRYVRWYLLDSGGDTVAVYDGASAEIPTGSLRPGVYTLVVRCYDYAFSELSGESYTGWFELYGTVEDQYRWTYEGRTYTVDVDYDYADYRSYADSASIYMRYLGGYDRVSEMTVVDGTVSELESDLRELYLGTYGSDAPTDGQAYADFILAFVQACFTYQTDQSLYGHEEWWAYPLETLYNGGGDCEDTSILCAAIYKAAGYETGVFLIPGHAITAVSLTDYTPMRMSPVMSYYYDVFEYTVDGMTYYGCETTLDTGIMGVGIISTDYTVTSDGKFLYEGEDYSDQADFGLYTV